MNEKAKEALEKAMTSKQKRKEMPDILNYYLGSSVHTDFTKEPSYEEYIKQQGGRIKE